MIIDLCWLLHLSLALNVHRLHHLQIKFARMAPSPRGGTARPVPSGTLLLRHIRKLATFTDQGEIDDAAIFIDANVIAWIGRDTDLPPEFASADEAMDLSHHVVIPGELSRTSRHFSPFFP